MAKKIYSKEEILDHHREAWNWIASKCEKGTHKNQSVYEMLEYYCSEHDLPGSDPCCIYESIIRITTGIEDTCKYCPILWGTEDKYVYMYCTAHGNGLYEQAQEASYARDYESVRKIALQIANLPEKIYENYKNHST